MGSNVLELAWAAGFMDGEGTFLFKKTDSGNKGRVQITCVQVHKEPLDRLCQAVGVGKVYGPYGPYSTNRQAHWSYTTKTKTEGETATKLLYPFLCGIKQHRADIALELANAAKTRPNLKTGPKPKELNNIGEPNAA